MFRKELSFPNLHEQQNKTRQTSWNYNFKRKQEKEWSWMKPSRWGTYDVDSFNSSPICSTSSSLFNDPIIYSLCLIPLNPKNLDSKETIFILWVCETELRRWWNGTIGTGTRGSLFKFVGKSTKGNHPYTKGKHYTQGNKNILGWPV